ncbi:MAG: hypothetical protein IKP49_03720 [Treponema sp.]|nr:hypothetical protein [Treponema sp.]
MKVFFKKLTTAVAVLFLCVGMAAANGGVVQEKDLSSTGSYDVRIGGMENSGNEKLVALVQRYTGWTAQYTEYIIRQVAPTVVKKRISKSEALKTAQELRDAGAQIIEFIDSNYVPPVESLEYGEKKQTIAGITYNFADNVRYIKDSSGKYYVQVNVSTNKVDEKMLKADYKDISLIGGEGPNKNFHVESFDTSESGKDLYFKFLMTNYGSFGFSFMGINSPLYKVNKIKYKFVPAEIYQNGTAKLRIDKDGKKRFFNVRVDIDPGFAQGLIKKTDIRFEKNSCAKIESFRADSKSCHIKFYIEKAGEFSFSVKTLRDRITSDTYSFSKSDLK